MLLSTLKPYNNFHTSQNSCFCLGQEAEKKITLSLQNSDNRDTRQSANSLSCFLEPFRENLMKMSQPKSKISGYLQRELAFYCHCTWGRVHKAMGRRIVLTFLLRNRDWTQCYRPVILVTHRAEAKDHKSKAGFGNIVRPCCKIQSEKRTDVARW